MTHYNVCVCGNAVLGATVHPECDWCDTCDDYRTVCAKSH